TGASGAAACAISNPKATQNQTGFRDIQRFRFYAGKRGGFNRRGVGSSSGNNPTRMRIQNSLSVGRVQTRILVFNSSHGMARFRRSASLHPRLLQRELDEAPDGAEAVFPSDLLAFFVRSSRVTDPHFVHAQPLLGNFDRNFGLKPETVFLEWNGLDHFPPENLVAGFHVDEVEIG